MYVGPAQGVGVDGIPVGGVEAARRDDPKPARRRALLAVSERLPRERPWKPPRKAMTLGRRVWWRESLSAASTASVPELHRKARTRGPADGIGARRVSRSQRSV